MARRRDWADELADRLFDAVRDGEDDDDVIARLSGALRRAATQAKELLPVTHGPLGEEIES